MGELVSTGEAARRLGCSLAYVILLDKSGDLLPAYRVDRGRFAAMRVYRSQDIEDFAAKRWGRRAAGAVTA
jgi:DNA-binding transcriptional MerR regulator